jgi:aryl-alcohol dehydrogenase-like predicted oxidoreductase
MKIRALGRTGIQVSPYALGTLMFATTQQKPLSAFSGGGGPVRAD